MKTRDTSRISAYRAALCRASAEAGGRDLRSVFRSNSQPLNVVELRSAPADPALQRCGHAPEGPLREAS